MKYFVTVLLICCFAGFCNAQITISSDDFISEYSQLGSTNVTSFNIASLSGSGVGTVAKTIGPGVSWDFSPFTFTQQKTSAITILPYSSNGAPAANDPDFSSANYIVKIAPSSSGGATTYQFMKLDATGFYDLGISSDTLGGIKLFSYVPPIQQYKFPLTYQTSWQTVSHSTISEMGTTADIFDTLTATVDGYGSLVTPTSAHGKIGASPMSSTNDALRITTKNTRVISVSGIPFSNITTYNYEWVTKSNHRVTATADQTQKLTNLSYSVIANSSVTNVSGAEQTLNLHLTSNPASNSETMLSYNMKSGGNAQVSMMDALGREVHILQNGYAQPGQNIIPIDPTKLSAGTYFLRVNAEGMTATRKLIVTK